MNVCATCIDRASRIRGPFAAQLPSLWAKALRTVLMDRVPHFDKKIVVCFPDTPVGNLSLQQFRDVFPSSDTTTGRATRSSRPCRPSIHNDHSNPRPRHEHNRVHLVRSADALDVAHDLMVHNQRRARPGYLAGVLCPADAHAVLGGYIGGCFEDESAIGIQELLAVRTTMLTMNRYLNPYPWHPKISHKKTKYIDLSNPRTTPWASAAETGKKRQLDDDQPRKTGYRYVCIADAQRLRMGNVLPPPNKIVWQMLRPAIAAWLEVMGRINGSTGSSTRSQSDEYAGYLECQTGLSNAGRCTRPCIMLSTGGVAHSKKRQPGINPLQKVSDATGDEDRWQLTIADLLELIKLVTVYRGLRINESPQGWPSLLNINAPGRPNAADIEFAHRTAIASPVHVVGTAYGTKPLGINSTTKKLNYKHIAELQSDMPRLMMVCVSPVNFSNVHDVCKFVVHRENNMPISETEASSAIESKLWHDQTGNTISTDDASFPFQLRPDNGGLLQQMEDIWCIALVSMHIHTHTVRGTLNRTLELAPTLVQPVLCALGCDAEACTGCSVFAVRATTTTMCHTEHPAVVVPSPPKCRASGRRHCTTSSIACRTLIRRLWYAFRTPRLATTAGSSSDRSSGHQRGTTEPIRIEKRSDRTPNAHRSAGTHAREYEMQQSTHVTACISCGAPTQWTSHTN